MLTKGDFIANHQNKININAKNTNGRRRKNNKGPTIQQITVSPNKEELRLSSELFI